MINSTDYVVDEWEPVTDEGPYWEPEPFTDEQLAELEARAEGPEGYCEELQYVRLTHTSKEDARENKKKACESCNWSSHRFFFYELVQRHFEGLTVRHLPPQPGKPWATRYLFLDLDNDAQEGHHTPDITAGELSQVLPGLGYPAAEFTPSTSRAPFKWHVLIFLGTPVRTSVEYIAACEKADSELRESLARLRGIPALPALRDPKVQWQSSLYGPYQESATEVILRDWECNAAGIPCIYKENEPHAERTLTNPQPRTRNSATPIFYDWLTPRSSSEFCRWLHRSGLSQVERIDDMEYDFKVHTPWQRRGASKSTNKFQEGSRHYSISAFGFALYNEARACNLWLDEHGLGNHKFSDSNIMTTFDYYTTGAYEVPDSFDLNKEKRELETLCKRFAHVPDREYLGRPEVAKYSTGRHRFRTRDYTRETTRKILEQFDDGSGTVRFESVEYREAYLRDQRVSVSTLRKTAREIGKTVWTSRKSSGGSRNGAGRKPGVSWETLGGKGFLIDGVFHYVAPLSSGERKWLERQKIKVKKSKVKK